MLTPLAQRLVNTVMETFHCVGIEIESNGMDYAVVRVTLKNGLAYRINHNFFVEQVVGGMLSGGPVEDRMTVKLWKKFLPL